MRHFLFGLLVVHGIYFSPTAFSQFGDEGFRTLKNPIGDWWTSHLLRSHDEQYVVFGVRNIRTSVAMKITDRGDLDRSFGDQGVMNLSFPEGDSFAFWATSILQEDLGSYLVLGLESKREEGDLHDRNFLWRVLPNGSLDTEFGFQELPQTMGQAEHIVKTSQGYLVVANSKPSRYSRSGDFMVYRYNPQFKLIDSHKIDMKLYVTRRAIVGPDGDVYVTGYREDGGHGFVAKLSPDGRLATDFGVGGIADLRRTGTVYGIAFADDGKILVTTSYYNMREQRFAAVARLTADGDLDRDFQDRGYQKVRGRLLLTRIQVTDSQEIVAAGSEGCRRHDVDCRTDAFVWKMKADGTFDDTFAEQGVRRLDRFDREHVDGLHVDDQGRIIIVEHSLMGAGAPPPQILRLKSDGSLDRS